MFKLNKFISLSLLGSLLIVGCERVDTFDKGKDFINNVNNNYVNKFNEVTSFSVVNNKYDLYSDDKYNDLEISNPYYTYSYDFNSVKKVNHIYINDNGLEYDYTLGLYKGNYYELYNLIDKYSVIDDIDNSFSKYNDLLDVSNLIKDNIKDNSLSILDGVLRVLEGRIESSYNLDYKIEFFESGSFKMLIELNDKDESIYYDFMYDDYLLSEYSVIYKDGINYRIDEYYFSYESNLNYINLFNYSLLDSKDNLDGILVNKYKDNIINDILENKNKVINDTSTFGYRYDYIIYKDGVKKSSFYESKLDEVGNIYINDDGDELYIILDGDFIFKVDVTDSSYEEIDKIEYDSYLNESKSNFRKYAAYLDTYLDLVKDNKNVEYYSNKPMCLDLELNSDDLDLIMNINDGLLSYLYVNNYTSEYDEYITLNINNYSYFEKIDYRGFNKK